MLTLMYRSDAAALLPFTALYDICSRSIKNNQRKGITGFLFEHEGTFLQIMEGLPSIIEPLYQKIMKDSRHQHVSLLRYDVNNDRRTFGTWAMNFGPLMHDAFWADEFAQVRHPKEFQRASHDPDFVFRALNRAYRLANAVMDTNPEISEFLTTSTTSVDAIA